MTGLLLQHNKVHDESLFQLSSQLKKEFSIKIGKMNSSEYPDDLLPYDVVKKYVEYDEPDFVITGDVFWRTGQNLCRACKELNIPLFFLQHGQWIYVQNKKKLNYYPTHTMLFGENIANMCSGWEYGKHSQIKPVGSPRYDNVVKSSGKYIFFSPPVIEEIIHDKPSGKIRREFFQNLKTLSGIDRYVSMVIQPHYREAKINWLHDLFPNAQFADPQLNASKLISGATKVLSSRNSTIVLDSIAHRKPVFISDLSEHDSCFYKRGYFEGFATESLNKQELLSNLMRDDTPINTIEYAERAKPYVCLGEASARVLKCIQQEMYNRV